MADTHHKTAKTKSGNSNSKKSGKTAHGKSSRAAHHAVQTSPTPARYREIQQALASKGYFNGEANGRWGADSADALRRFQHDQNLDASGKLDSVSLIALGLGPKRSLTAQSNPQPSQTRP